MYLNTEQRGTLGHLCYDLASGSRGLDIRRSLLSLLLQELLPLHPPSFVFLSVPVATAHLAKET